MKAALIEVLETAAAPGVAQVHLARLGGRSDRLVEVVDALDPDWPEAAKWVAVVSTQLGCPAGCRFCDAGGAYRGDLAAGEILAQIELVFGPRLARGGGACPKIKLHFARMGEPALNPAVLDVLEELPDIYRLPGLIPTVATIAPRGAGRWLARLAEIKDRLYPDGRFQLQFSVNSTDEERRDWLMPFPHWSLAEIADFGRRWHVAGDRRVTLNFALAEGVPVEPAAIAARFDPRRFLVKLTPVNPTAAANAAGLRSPLSAAAPDGAGELAAALRRRGFEVLVSIGSPAEVELGSNCGQRVRRWLADYSAVAARPVSGAGGVSSAAVRTSCRNSAR